MMDTQAIISKKKKRKEKAMDRKEKRQKEWFILSDRFYETLERFLVSSVSRIKLKPTTIASAEHH